MDLEKKPRSSLVKFKDPGVYIMTAEEEDKKYGCLRTFTEKAEKELLSCVDPKDLHFNLRTHDLLWEGWHAAFIASKEVKPTYLGKVSRVLGKRKLNESDPMLAEETKMCIDNSEDEPDDDSEEIPTEFRDEFAVAILAYEIVLRFWKWPMFKSMFPKDVYQTLVERLFEAAVKLVLSIFDKEDFQRICYRFQIRNEHYDFYHVLFDTDDHHKAISMFPNLWESDIYDALHQFVHHGEFTKLKPLKLEPTVMMMDPCYVSKALELMKKYVPLKANIKMQLLLEHAELKCFHVTDSLVLQAIHSVDLAHIIGDCNDEEEKRNLLYELADDMLVGFNNLTITKASELVFAEECVTAPLIHQFGPCELEVIDVIKLANHERRVSNARFIRKEHILSALSLSRVRDFVETMEIDTELCYQWGSSELYTYELYRLSSYLAKEKDVRKNETAEIGCYDAVLDGFNDLTLTKASETVFAEQRVTAPIIHQFGPCEHEVIDVIKLTNIHERMLSNARFIGEEHILSALSLSRVRDFLENMEIDTELRYQGGSSELYTYELYQLSSHLAKKKMENLDKCFHQQSELLKSLRLCKSKYSVPCWRNVDVLMVLMGKRCRYGETYTCNGREVVDKLYEEIRSGNLKLPKDEELFAML